MEPSQTGTLVVVVSVAVRAVIVPVFACGFLDLGPIDDDALRNKALVVLGGVFPKRFVASRATIVNCLSRRKLREYFRVDVATHDRALGLERVTVRQRSGVLRRVALILANARLATHIDSFTFAFDEYLLVYRFVGDRARHLNLGPVSKSLPLRGNFGRVFGWVLLKLRNASFTAEIHRAVSGRNTQCEVDWFIHDWTVRQRHVFRVITGGVVAMFVLRMG